MLGHQSWQAWFLCILITSSYRSNDMFIKVETCLNLSEEGGPLEGISIIKPWKRKLKLLSCSGPSNSRLCVIFLIVYGFCSEAWLLVMSLRRQLSIQYHPRCLLYKRPKLLDFSHNLSPLHFLMMVPSHSPSQALSQGFPSHFAESQGLQPENWVLLLVYIPFPCCLMTTNGSRMSVSCWPGSMEVWWDSVGR